ncbi:restriction endonuclease subunit S [Photobacterium leiognathi]|uniref:restriction endonuclease subunit S n=1 Tax=Photobacterium leiognathi TaxID=553611 RepID=UPI0027393405|nr:restriction endonuclease subunit S [Photobacterium leiognathi]
MSALEQSIPEGYKDTDSGIIPNDWKVLKIDDMSTKVGSGKTPTGGASVYVDSGRPFVRSQNVGSGSLRLADLTYITEETHSTFTGSELKTDDVLLNITGASIGRCALATPSVDGGNVNQHVCIIRVNKAKATPYLIQTLINSDSGQNQIDSYQAGGNREGLNFSQVRSMQFPLSNHIEEQTAIANALSDVDALLTELEKLIAKKQAIKTATMQQLLTGKNRLPQFAIYTEGEKEGQPKGTKTSELGEIPEDWEVQFLKDISSMRGRIGWQGLKQEEFTFNDQQPFLITGMNFKDGKIRWKEVYHIPEDRYEMDRNIQLKVGDILMTKDGTIGKLLFVDHIPKPYKATLNSHLLLFRPKLESYVPKYLYYLMKTKLLDDHIELHKSGSTFFGITQEAMGKLLALLPSNEEQTAIATILSDMDSEIQTLEQRLAKTCQIKQGMMQELLTGRTRLPFKKDS